MVSLSFSLQFFGCTAALSLTVILTADNVTVTHTPEKPECNNDVMKITYNRTKLHIKQLGDTLEIKIKKYQQCN